MDLLDDVLRSVRGEGVLFGLTELAPPWALPFAGDGALTVAVPLRGEALIVRPGAAAHRVRPGETAVVRGPFTARGGEPAVLLAGVYRTSGHVPRRLLEALPAVLVLPDAQECGPMHDYLLSLEPGARSGRQVVVDRLMDWLLVCTLRHWFDLAQAEAPGWHRAATDDVVGPALRAMHEAPERPWTLAALAGRAGVSRTTLAKRFTGLVGEPPLTYLTGWRMSLAADLLTEPAATVAAVARRVGYADAFSFSAAFKRVHGVPPSAHRRGAVTAGR